MDAFPQTTSLPLSQVQKGNHDSSSSSSLNYSLSIKDYHINQFEFSGILHNNHNSDPSHNPNPPQFTVSPSYQDSSSLNFPAYSIVNEQTPVWSEMTTGANTSESSDISVYATWMTQANNFHSDMCNGESVHDGTKIAFRIKTELETLDDGYKWRKYGKKKVKSSPNPRNYYKCSTSGCKVKKRFERDRYNSSYVIATYIGRHNHHDTDTIYCNKMHPTSI